MLASALKLAVGPLSFSFSFLSFFLRTALGSFDRDTDTSVSSETHQSIDNFRVKNRVRDNDRDSYSIGDIFTEIDTE